MGTHYRTRKNRRKECPICIGDFYAIACSGDVCETHSYIYTVKMCPLCGRAYYSHNDAYCPICEINKQPIAKKESESEITHEKEED